MRNYSKATVAQTEAFRAHNYDVALEWARTEQKAAPSHVAYTVDITGENGEILLPNTKVSMVVFLLINLLFISNQMLWLKLTKLFLIVGGIFLLAYFIHYYYSFN